MDEFKEFWVSEMGDDISPGVSLHWCSIEKPTNPNARYFRVVEYGAYEQAIADIEKLRKTFDSFDLPEGVVWARWKERALKYEAALREIIKDDELTWKQYPQSKGIYSHYADIALKALGETVS